MKTLTIGQVVDVDCIDGFGGPATVVATRDEKHSRYKVHMNDNNPVDPFWAHDFEIRGLEPMMTRDDVIRSTAAHIRRVGELLVEQSAELSRRAVVHDASKWSPEEWPAFEEATPKLAGMTYGSDEYKAALASIRPALKHHYAENSHHPEHFPERSLCVQCGQSEAKPCTCGGPRQRDPGGVNSMTLADLLEMLCDWKAAGERHADGSIIRSLEHNRERFQIGPQLMRILENTAKAAGWVKSA